MMGRMQNVAHPTALCTALEPHAYAPAPRVPLLVTTSLKSFLLA